MKNVFLMALGVVLLASLLAFGANFNNWNRPLGVNNAEIIKSITLYVDSLGNATQTVTAFTCPRQIKIKAGCVATSTVFVADTGVAAGRGEIILRSGSYSATIYADSNSQLTYTDHADVTIPAATPCTLLIADDVTGGTDYNGSGGFDAKITFWYTDN